MREYHGEFDGLCDARGEGHRAACDCKKTTMREARAELRAHVNMYAASFLREIRNSKTKRMEESPFRPQTYIRIVAKIFTARAKGKLGRAVLL